MSKDAREMIDKVKNFKQSVNENYNQNKFDIAKLSKVGIKSAKPLLT